jgi:hypothetical protein
MTNRFEEARQLDLLALLRVRAEVLLEREDIAPEDREELVRIASEPKPEDRDYLGSFDHLFEEDDG